MTEQFSSAPRERHFNPIAIAGFVVGLICPFYLSTITAPAAVILGHFALFQIKRTEGKQRGTGIAIAGLTLGYFSLALGAIGLMLYLFKGSSSSSLSPFIYTM